MNMKELWSLYPVSPVAPKGSWKTWYTEEEGALRKELPDAGIIRIEHIGSTALCNIWAKNIIDILMEVKTQDDMIKIRNILLTHGYRCMKQSDHRVSLYKGYNHEGMTTRIYHLHIRLKDDNDELYFRDFLMAHPDVAAEYENLKLALIKEYGTDKQSYLLHKGEFVKKYTQIAKELYKGRYE